MSINFTLIGLFFNFIGTLLLSIPTVDGLRYLTPIVNYIKKPFLIIENVLGILLVIWIIFHLIGIDLFVIAIFMEIDQGMSFLEIASVIYKPLAILILPILITRGMVFFLNWLEADQEHKLEKEKRAGSFGILLILLSCIIQMIDALTK